MSGIAEALGVSKALFYHYYKAKDDLLFDIIRSHLVELVEAAELKALERRLVDVMASVVAALNPSLPPRHVKPLAMSIFGTLNWKYMWFREGGPVSRADYAALATRLFAQGIEALG
jgi:TetR/AcrR family transcriptional regulator